MATDPDTALAAGQGGLTGPQPVGYLYRFRPLRHLLGKNELRNQEIYFAKPDELNDPMEGFRDVYWHGDAIVWKNFFRHYAICLDNAFSQWMIVAEDQPLEWDHIPVFNHGNINEGVPYQSLETELLAALFSEPRVQRLIDALARKSLPTRSAELAAILQATHLFFVFTIHSAHEKRGLAPAIANADEMKAQALQLIEPVIEIIENFQTASRTQPIDPHQVEAYYVARHQIVNELQFIRFYHGQIDVGKANRNFVVLSFPDDFVKRVEALVYPDWYAACFMAECRNSANWGVYGDNHTAVCLKFNASAVAHAPGLSVSRQIGVSGGGPIVDFVPLEFRKIAYDSSREPIDFFRLLGRFPIPVLRRFWYSDENGNHSPCGEDIFRADAAWIIRYWDKFYHAITRKLGDWSHEQEYRLILDDYHFDHRAKPTRTLRYNFSDLEGLIFGIKTPLEAKLDICRIIEEKCRAEQRTNFKFYQAFYSPRTGAIEHAETNLWKFQT